MRLWCDETVERRKCARPHTLWRKPCPNDAALLYDRIRPLFNSVTKPRTLRFARRSNALTVSTKLPAMKCAANAAALLCAFQSTKRQIRTAMRARAIKQYELARQRIAKEYEVLSQRSHRLCGPSCHPSIERRIELGGKRNGLPITSQQTSTWGLWTDTCESFVLGGTHTAMIALRTRAERGEAVANMESDVGEENQQRSSSAVGAGLTALSPIRLYPDCRHGKVNPSPRNGQTLATETVFVFRYASSASGPPSDP